MTDAPFSLLAKVFLQEDLNFLITNRLPRRYATQLMAWFSRIESRTLTRASVAVWSCFAGNLRLDEARRTDFGSLHEVFVRELKQGVRPVHSDPRVAVSPCDAVVGACGQINGTEVLQAKGYPYSLGELLCDDDRVARYRDGMFVTLRLKSSMYHRFHAPLNARVAEVLYISGDTWNVNPIALKRVERLFCKNQRAILDLIPEDPALTLTLVPVAAILVGGVQLHCLDQRLELSHRGTARFACDASVSKGQELGYFQSGSTIIVFASRGWRLSEPVSEGKTLRMGQPLLERS
ncbi:MAG: archaetidylserine decarboxylase [Myxococcaceae bacterium]